VAHRKAKAKKNYAEIFWPEYCRKNRAFLNEEQIVIDLITKIRGSRSSLTWWTLIEEIDLNTYNKSHKNIISRYYNLTSPTNPFFSISDDRDLEQVQLRILVKVWQYLNRTMYIDERPKIEPPKTG
jgi:hypothetical protein